MKEFWKQNFLLPGKSSFGEDWKIFKVKTSVVYLELFIQNFIFWQRKSEGKKTKEIYINLLSLRNKFSGLTFGR